MRALFSCPPRALLPAPGVLRQSLEPWAGPGAGDDVRGGGQDARPFSHRGAPGLRLRPFCRSRQFRRRRSGHDRQSRALCGSSRASLSASPNPGRPSAFYSQSVPGVDACRVTYYLPLGPTIVSEVESLQRRPVSFPMRCALMPMSVSRGRACRLTLDAV